MRFKLPLALFALALGLRLAHVFTLSSSPFYEFLPLDADAYDRWARAILGGEVVRSEPFYQAPLYAYVLAGIYKVAPDDLLAPRLVNALFGALHVVLVYTLGRLLFSRAVGAVAALLCALYAPFLFEEGKVMKTALGLLLSTGALVAAVAASKAGAPSSEAIARTKAPPGSAALSLLAGFAGGLASLVRENFLLVALGFAILWFVRGRRRDATALLAGLGLACLPALAHNLLATGEPILLTSQAGQNFYIGNFSGNPSGGYHVPEFVRRNPRFEEADFRAEAERRAGRPLRAGEVSSFWFSAALRELAADPLRFPVLVLRKCGLLYNHFEIPDDEDLRFARLDAPVLRLPLFEFTIVGILGLLGVVVLALRRRLDPDVSVYLAVYTFSVACFFVFSRYRLPLVAPLSVFAAERLLVGWRHIRTWFVAQRVPTVSASVFRTLAEQLALAFPIAVLVLRPIDDGISRAESYLSRGIAYAATSREEEALRSFRSGLEIEPRHPKLLRHLARGLAENDPQSDETIAALRAALAAASPTPDAELEFRLASGLAARGEGEEALGLFLAIAGRGEEPPGLWVNLALLHGNAGRLDEARAAAERGLLQSPGDTELQSLAQELAARTFRSQTYP